AAGGAVPAPRRTRPGFGDRVPAGPLRLASRYLAAQFAWLLPIAVVGLGLVASEGPWRLPLTTAQAGLLLWGGWLFIYGVVYSAAAGIFRAYYLVTMAPPLAALTGLGLVRLWRAYGRRGRLALLLPVALLLTAIWEAYLQSYALVGIGHPAGVGPWAVLVSVVSDWRTWLLGVLLGGSLVSVVWLLAQPLGRPLPEGRRRLAIGVLTAGMAALLVTPGAWALSSVLAGSRGGMVSADLSRFGSGSDRGGFPARAWSRGLTDKLIPFLEANRRGERYLLATSNAFLAAPIIVKTGEPVMAMGGFLGTDPILTAERLAQLVADRELRFALIGEVPAWGQAFGAGTPARQLTDWVRTHGTRVDPARWRPADPPEGGGEVPPPPPLGPTGAAQRRFGRGFGFRAANWELYDLRPEAGLAQLTSG
ncbi:MAG TPA: hypothetical protein VMG58_12540, partial [Candidatus Sulfotelmatobacter sp.]|nr:hypothetical protein [Candidatus Sulfotelmatobacter sp.]